MAYFDADTREEGCLSFAVQNEIEWANTFGQ